VKLAIALLIVAAPMYGQVFPHIAVGGGYTTDFLIFNPTASAGSFSVAFYDDNGKAMNVNLPALNGPGIGFQDKSLPAGGSIVVSASNQVGSTVTGSAVITASTGLVAQAMFRAKSADGNYYEAAVPANPGSTRFVVPFDDTTFSENGVQIFTGIAIANVDAANSAKIACTAKNDAGVVIQNAVSVPLLQPHGHWADYRFPLLVGKRGLLDCVANTNIAALGLRALGPAFSSLTVDMLTASMGGTGSTTGGGSNTGTSGTGAANSVNEPYFSFSYAAGWKVSVQNDNSVSAADVITQRSVAVIFLPGVPNTSTTFVQCASESDVLLNYYNTNFLPLATNPDGFPNTTVTYELFTPGQLGGISTWISVNKVDANGYPAGSQLTYVEVVPKEEGAYIVQYQHQSEPEDVSEPIRQAFLKSIVLKASPLDKNAYCNYLGK
jgi:hypothetical protein